MLFTEYPGSKYRCAGRSGGSVDGGSECQQCPSVSGNGWNLYRRGKCPEFPADHRYTVFLFIYAEDSGYMARVAFVMDKLLRKIGLSGRSIVPMLVGFGCTVPGVMASRTLPSERDRKMTILLTPFMSCSAKLPIYAFLRRHFPEA